MPHPLHSVDLLDRVQQVLDSDARRQAERLAPLGPDADLMLDAAVSLLRGGKRLRAAYLYWGYRAMGGHDSDALIRAATSMEIFQAAALLHDDVMDGSDTRRGQPSAHRALAAQHRERRWSGDPDRFGEAGAILTGDLCLTWSDEVYACSGLPAEELAAGRPAFDRMRNQLMVGQFLDVIDAARGWEQLGDDERLARARSVVHYKSARYSILEPLVIGASARGADDTQIAALTMYGEAIGEAFQLRDDVLGVFGDPQQTGKPAGDDLIEGKHTVMVAYTLAGLSPDARQAFADRLGRADLSTEQIHAMRRDIEASGGLERTEALITEDLQRGLDAISGIDLTDEGRQALIDLADIATARMF